MFNSVDGQKQKHLGPLILILLTLVTLIVVLMLPRDQKGAEQFNPNLWAWWLIVGTIHCFLVAILLVYGLVIRKRKRKPISTEIFLVMGIMIVWIAFVASWTRLGYLRNKYMQIPENSISTDTIEKQGK